MSDHEQNKILRMLEAQNLEHQKMSNDIKMLADQHKETIEKLTPIFEIYSSFKGFGTIGMGFIKWVVVPLTVVIGLYFSIEKLFGKQ